MKLFSQIFYADSVYPRCWKNFVFINFSNIQDKTGKEFLFISWQYHGNLSVSLKTRKILCIQNLPYQKDWKIWESQKKECRCRNYLMLPAFPFQRLANETYINGLLLLFCKNLEMKVTQLSVEEKQTLKEIFSRSKPAKEHRKLRRRNPKL